MPQPDRRISPGGWVLVTGANGYIASHVVDILLDQGYNVRGTVRNEKLWLNRYFETKYGKGGFQTFILPDLEDQSAFDKAVNGVSGVVHIATDVSFSTDVHAVVAKVVAGTVNVLQSAAKEPSVKSVVLTSSSSAALIPVPNQEGVVVDQNTWNDAAVKAAYSGAAPAEQLPFLSYAASKTEGEHAFWDWVKTNNPSFAVNSVLPNMAMGPIPSPEMYGSTMGFIRELLEGKTDKNIDMFPPQWYIDVRDIARVHVAALLDPTVQSERLFAFAGPFNWNDIIRILKKLRPGNTNIPAAPENEGRDLSDVWKASKRAEELIRSFFGVKGWISLEESLEAGIVDLK
ncbi:hypothetical protein A1O3_09566 [Capronia epimyces CBS 606.96]|uniref:NAD-dependent epimerase/dehydratase domain-containing protein n=1 Tax=Capronia epimyces CBS 606.96 TaxID=1182542 RepID=W9XJ39_9EURO|nr:uncharacterized protein A1O3_09566 [Capronia epimyces CBS 606.96]EXJ77340.1 hypothetical protein A1O3_09566 [Capronia epimyces CBS 606.96]